MGAAAAVVLMKERHIVDAFQIAGATTRERALTTDDARVDTYGIGWRRLVSRGIVREATPGHYYVDMIGWHSLRRMRRRVLFVVIAAALLVALAATFGSAFMVHTNR